MTDNISRLTYAEAQTKIQFEHTLISHRMSWLFTAHVFLFAAFFALSAIGHDDPRYDIFSEYRTIVMAVGAVISAAVFMSVAAAHFAMASWISASESKNREYLVSTQWTHSFGEFSSSAISLVFIFVWFDLIAMANLPHYNPKNIHITFLLMYAIAFVLYHSLVVWRKIRRLEAANRTSSSDGEQEHNNVGRSA